MADPEIPARLPSGVTPHHYDLELAPDLDAATFAGSVAVDLAIDAHVSSIVCNAAELQIISARLEAGDEITPLVAETDPEAERLTLTPADAAARLPAGEARLRIEFTGALNDQLRGFYRSAYTDETGVSHNVAITQFESTDARRAFPCWDEPSLKATFAVTLIVADGLLAVSNAAESSRERLDDGRVRVRFATTMPMSTYLAAFVVGDLQATEPVECAGVPVRVIHRPGRGAQTAFALDVAAHALEWFSQYYGLAYPSDKLDLVAIPDFASGAMENLGCVTFREVLLLVDPAAASQPELQRVAEVVNHELAHMWFGDLVTMAWWDGLWLNEAFATFMETACTDAYRPDWQVWSTFCRSRASAFSVDALAATRPVEYPVRSPDEAEDMFDVITYEKGAALLRMLEQYLGEDAFRAGVRLYLRRHAHANTVTADLWEALAEASSQPVGRIMHGWIHQGGHPAVRARLTEHGLELSQRRFTLDPERADDREWIVPVRLRVRGADGEEHELKTLLDKPRRILTASPHAVVTVNSGSSGFYRTEPDASELDSFCDLGPGGLDAAERHGLVSDAWAATLAARLEAAEFLSFVTRGFRAELDLNVWQAIASALGHIRRIVSDDDAALFARAVLAASDAAFAQVGWAPSEDESARSRELRATLLGLRGATAGDAATIAACRERLDHDDPTLAAAALGVVACHGDDADFERFRRRYESADDAHTEQRHLGALADFPSPRLVLSILEGAFDGSVRSQDAPYLIRRALANHRCGAATWSFLAQHWAQIVTFIPSNSVARMLAGVTALDRPELADEIHRFLGENPVPQGAKQVSQHLELLDVNVALRSRESRRLAAALPALAEAL